MKYKVGDRVRIKNFDWYNENKNKSGLINCGYVMFTYGMSKYCGKVLTIRDVEEEISYYRMKECNYMFTDEMIEGLVEEETYDFLKTDKPNRPSLNDFMDMLDNKIKLPEGYVFKDENGNIINATKIVLEKKKKEYPKTYEECRDLIEGSHVEPFCADLVATGYLSKLMERLVRLIICRDAYWKLYGEEMGLGEPWKPYWEDYEQKKFVYVVEGNTLIEKEYSIQSCILAFPTPEMRNAFKENFDPDIEFCKEFL